MPFNSPSPTVELYRDTSNTLYSSSLSRNPGMMVSSKEYADAPLSTRTFAESLLQPVRDLAVGPTVRADPSSVLDPKDVGLSIGVRDHSGINRVGKREIQLVENGHHH